jgi:hypothetical protein
MHPYCAALCMWTSLPVRIPAMVVKMFIKATFNLLALEFCI